MRILITTVALLLPIAASAQARHVVHRPGIVVPGGPIRICPPGTVWRAGVCRHAFFHRPPHHGHGRPPVPVTPY